VEDDDDAVTVDGQTEVRTGLRLCRIPSAHSENDEIYGSLISRRLETLTRLSTFCKSIYNGCHVDIIVFNLDLKKVITVHCHCHRPPYNGFHFLRSPNWLRQDALLSRRGSVCNKFFNNQERQLTQNRIREALTQQGTALEKGN
jgi:hypothetical protein